MRREALDASNLFEWRAIQFTVVVLTRANALYIFAVKLTRKALVVLWSGVSLDLM